MAGQLTTGFVLAGFGAQWVSIFAAILAALVATVTLAVNLAATRRDRRRNLYSEAYRATMSWIELAYRAYHAPPDDGGKFLDAYHTLWEDVRYYQGRLLMESTELGYSFALFKEAVQVVCETAIESSWSGLPHDPNIIAPRHRVLTCIPVVPSVR